MEEARIFNIPSSTSSRIYTVRKMPDGEMKCSCPHYVFREKQCKHIVEAIKILQSEHEKLKQA